MPQISLYIDEATLKRVETLAKKEHKSISKWVRIRIKDSLENSWPDNYFSLFGSVADKNFVRPKGLKPKNDVTREKL
jgi:hypothetical protein